MAPLGYSGAQEKLIHETNLQTKISCRTPFKAMVSREFPNVEIYCTQFILVFNHSLYMCKGDLNTMLYCNASHLWFLHPCGPLAQFVLCTNGRVFIRTKMPSYWLVYTVNSRKQIKYFSTIYEQAACTIFPSCSKKLSSMLHIFMSLGYVHLSSEMDLAEIRFIRKVFIKEWGAEV